MKFKVNGFTGCAIVALVVPALYALGTWLFQLLWNWTVPTIFKGPSLTFWQALALWLLISVIAGAFNSVSKNR